tara:strand:- start:192 stop:305 length:114 start_codon:yes stop_codon:yes gene_type:complete
VAVVQTQAAVPEVTIVVQRLTVVAVDSTVVQKTAVVL